MAEDVTPTPAPAPERDLPILPSRRDRARQSSYRFRFGILYVVLAAIVGAGIGSFVVLATGDGPAEEEAWSNWRPEGRENAYPTEIARHVASRYRLPTGKQLVGIFAGPAEVQDLPIRGVLIQHDATTPAKQDEVEAIEAGNSVMFNLCGVGQKCSVQGPSSPERARLLRREALELALYTFKYADDVDSVIALMPVSLGDPATEQDDTSTALFFEKKDFGRQLSRPLQRTLSGQAGTVIDPAEGLVVDTLTQPRHYLYDIQATQDLGAVLRFVPFRG
jgi:hypothetical protein